jgi:hypothetical protein
MRSISSRTRCQLTLNLEDLGDLLGARHDRLECLLGRREVLEASAEVDDLRGHL